MLDSVFTGLFDTQSASGVEVGQFLLCLGAALVLGLAVALCYMFRTRYSRSFVATLAMLPAVVCVVILMVNGNIGAGVAVAGAFSLVRFRSAPGTAKEIGTIFLAMGAGLMCGMGYLGYAALFTAIMCGVLLLYTALNFGAGKRTPAERRLSVTIPEDLDYTGVFDDIFRDYTTGHELVQVKTSNMGSMFRLTYHIVLREASREKEMIDQLRCRNGNLEISVSAQENGAAEL